MRSRRLRVLRALGAWARARPATLAIAGLVLVASIVATAASGGRHLAVLSWLGTGPAQLGEADRAWTLLTFTLVAVGARSIIISVVAVIVLLGIVEPLLGWRRLVLAWVAISIVGGVLAVSVISALVTIDPTWVPAGDEMLIASPFAAAVGTMLAGSAAQGATVRRRIRVFSAISLTLLVVAVGQPVEVTAAAFAAVGLGFGMLAFRGHGKPTWRRSDAHEMRTLLSGTMAALGIAPLIALWEPNRHNIAQPLADVVSTVVGVFGSARGCTQVAGGCHAASPVAGLTPAEVAMSVLPWLLFLIAAWGIWRGMRIAVWIGIALNIAVVVLVGYYWLVAPSLATIDTDAPGLAPARTDASRFLVQTIAILTVYALAAWALWHWRHSCARLPEQRRIIVPLIVIGVSAVALMLAYVGFVLADPGDWTPQPTLPVVLADAPERLLPIALLVATPEAIAPTTFLASAVSWSIAPIFNLIVLAAVAWMVVSGSVEDRPLPRARVVALLREGGGTSLSHMATWRHMRHWVDDETGAMVPYRLERDCAIVLGGPIGAPDAAPVDVLARFAHVADTRGWIPAVYAAPGELEPAFAAIGWRCVEVGEESVIHPQEWSTKGKKWQNVRSSINRAEREGVIVRWTAYDELTVAQARELRTLSAEWVGEKALPEMGFTLGGIAELDDPDVRLALAMHEGGRIEAATSWLPTWRHGEIVGWTLDFMRRRPDGMNGVMEMLIAHVAERLRDEHAEFMSLSTAPLASTVSLDDDAAETEPTAPLDALLAYLSAQLEPLYGFGSLLRFKQKFQPELHPIVLAYGDPLHLPAIGLALTRAYLPGVSIGQLATSFRQQRADGRADGDDATG